MTVDLETRMRTAGESLRRASLGLSPAVPPRRDHRRMVVLAVAAALVVAGLASAVALVRHDDGADDLTTGVAAPTDVPGDAVAQLEGDYAEGTWAVYLDGDGRLCGATWSGDAGSSVCTGGDERAVVLHDNDGDPTVLFGLLPEGTVALGTPGASASWNSWNGSQADDGRSIYAIVLRREPLPTKIEFHHEDGTVDTAPVDT